MNHLPQPSPHGRVLSKYRKSPYCPFAVRREKLSPRATLAGSNLRSTFPNTKGWCSPALPTQCVGPLKPVRPPDLHLPTVVCARIDDQHQLISRPVTQGVFDQRPNFSCRRQDHLCCAVRVRQPFRSSLQTSTNLLTSAKPFGCPSGFASIILAMSATLPEFRVFTRLRRRSQAFHEEIRASRFPVPA